MNVPKLEAEICKYLHHLSLAQQRQALEYVRALASAHVRGVPGRSLLRFAGTIDASDLATMAQAIEDGCEHIHGEDW